MQSVFGCSTFSGEASPPRYTRINRVKSNRRAKALGSRGHRIVAIAILASAINAKIQIREPDRRIGATAIRASAVGSNFQSGSSNRRMQRRQKY